MDRRFQQSSRFSGVIRTDEERERSPWFSGWLPGLALIALLLVGLIALAAVRGRRLPGHIEPIKPALRTAPPPSVLPWASLRFPTAQRLLTGGEVTGVFQSTGSGNPESGRFGSTRTASRGGQTMSSFHEGLDIAAVERDRQGRPKDTVHAIAQGQVMYVNRVGGNSTYGKYVVIAHDDPVGEVYSLYAHLADVQTGVWPGKRVAAGELIGPMGNTASTGIPVERAHLHLEVALMANARFDAWYRAQKLTPDHGSYHGQNLVGADPLLLFKTQQRHPNMQFMDVLMAVPRAFELALRTPQPLDFFQRYKPLWKGAAAEGQPIVVACSENGLPLEGRAATPAETGSMGKRSCLVQNANETALGRNGSHLITRIGSNWSLTESGQRWLEALTYVPGAMPIGYRSTVQTPAAKKGASTTRSATRTTRR